MVAISLITIFLLVLQDILLLLFLIFNFKTYNSNLQQTFPAVTILIPARNEFLNLPFCLSSLEKLSYPKEKLQFIMGDDQSGDGTLDLLNSWMSNKPHGKVISILPQPLSAPKVNGKANALSQMAKEATGEYFLFTDADCKVPEGWVEEMLAGCDTETAIVTGITTVSPNSFFSRMQRIDWLLTLGMVKVLDDFGIAITSMGNNMLISREAYEKVGGFAGIGYSLTEDLEIAKKIKERGYKGVHQVSPKNLIRTSAISGWSNLLQQRKRWMSGAMSLPFYWKILLLLQVLFFPFILYLVAINPIIGIVFWIVKILIQGIFIRVFSRYAGETLKILELIIFEIYYLFISWSTIVYYFWPSKTKWKGRLYP